MMWWNGDTGWWMNWISGFVMLAFWALVVLGIILLVRSLSGSGQHAPPPAAPPWGPGGPPASGTPTGGPPAAGMHGQQPPAPGQEPPPGQAPAQALAILQERYARGEIDREEFLQKKADLGD